MVRGPRRPPLRGISNTLAGLIVITFVLLAIVPTIISIYTSSVANINRAAMASTLKLALKQPQLNVTLIDATLNTKVYIVENMDSKPYILKLLVVGSGSRIYLAEAASAYGVSLLLDSATGVRVQITPLHGASKTPEGVRLAPGGAVEITVTNGELLRIVTKSGGLSVQAAGTGGPANYSQYAAVAGSIQTNYVDLTNFTSLDDLATSGDILLVSDPSENTTNTTLLERGAIESYCFAGSLTPVAGGFQPPFTGADKIEASYVYIHNIGPLAGTLILGGKVDEYSANPIGVALYMPTYMLAAMNRSEPGIIFVKSPDYGTMLCVDWIIDDSRWGWAVLGACYPHNFAQVDSELSDIVLDDIFASHLYSDKNAADDVFISTTWSYNDYDTGGRYLLAPDMGFLAYSDRHVVYCKPGAYELNVYPNGTISLKPDPNNEKGCIIFYAYPSGSNSRIYIGYLEEDAVFSLEEEKVLANGIHTGSVDMSIKATMRGYVEADTGRWYPSYPMVLKILNATVDKDFLALYDGYDGVLRRGTESFGIYYYSGFSSGDVFAYYYVVDFLGTNATLALYRFVEGETSGLKPFTLIADTDGNGLSEVIFIDEWFKPGPVYYRTYFTEVIKDYDLSDVYIGFGSLEHPVTGEEDFVYRGCIDKVIGEKFIYLKFGDRYAVDGSQIAEVSIQIRYSFHDAVGGDTEEIDDPKEGIWGFFVADSNGTIVTSATYIYQQLEGLEDTWPPNMNFVSEAVFLPIPDKPEKYYILYGFSDPYDYTESGLNDYVDDLEYTVRIEWIGMWYLHR